MNHEASTRDLVVIGCSAGGVDALPRVLHQLPRELPAAVCIVQHLAVTRTPYLVDILRKQTDLPVQWAEQGQPIAPGHVYVAPPDHHLLLTNGHLQLSRSARESFARPSIDKLFRSAAAHHGSAVIAVLLTGTMEDGVAGLCAVREAGGVVIVQDPADAAFGELPRRALEAVTPDRTIRLDEVGSAVMAFVGQPVEPAPVPEALSVEAGIDEIGVAVPAAMQRLGPQSTIACPECHGPTWRVGDEHARRFRCYLGHVHGAPELLATSSRQIEAALWSAVRALHDRATTLETLASDALRLGQEQSAEAYAARAREVRAQADLARQFMFDLARRG